MTMRTVPPASTPDVDTKCSDRIRRARLHTGLSKELVIARVNEILTAEQDESNATKEPKLLTNRTYRDWESGATLPKLGRRFLALASVLRQSPGWLAIGEGDFHEHDPASGNGSGRRPS